MRALQVHELGKPMTLDEVSMPKPAKGEVLVKVHTCGINFADTLIVQGSIRKNLTCPLHREWRFARPLKLWVKELPT